MKRADVHLYHWISVFDASGYATKLCRNESLADLVNPPYQYPPHSLLSMLVGGNMQTGYSVPSNIRLKYVVQPVLSIRKICLT